MQLIRTLLSCPVAMFCGIAGVSIFALVAALYSEVALGLEPCILCIYQRVPFAIGAVLGLVGLMLRNKPKTVDAILGLLGINFLVNSGIAFYHSGVEQQWWASSVEGCSASFEGLESVDTPASTQTLLENIMSAPTGDCSKIPWQDPLLGLSMANYNVLLCLGIFAACALSIWIRKVYGSGCVIPNMTCD